MKKQKIVVFDLDETLGHFTEFGVFIDGLENWLHKSISRNTFYKVLDVFASFYFRPNILYILRYLREKKKAGVCSKVMIYTNNNGPRRWVLSIKSYLEYKLNYKLFDRIIAAYKIGHTQIEKNRTSHEKSYKDLLACGHISKNAKICFFDDIWHPKMKHDNILYVQLKQYKHTVPIKTLVDMFLRAKVSKNIKNKNEFRNHMYNFMDQTRVNNARAGGSYLPQDEKKQILSRLHYFLYKF